MVIQQQELDHACDELLLAACLKRSLDMEVEHARLPSHPAMQFIAAESTKLLHKNVLRKDLESGRHSDALTVLRDRMEQAAVPASGQIFLGLLMLEKVPLSMRTNGFPDFWAYMTSLCQASERVVFRELPAQVARSIRQEHGRFSHSDRMALRASKKKKEYTFGWLYEGHWIPMALQGIFGPLANELQGYAFLTDKQEEIRRGAEYINAIMCCNMAVVQHYEKNVEEFGRAVTKLSGWMGPIADMLYSVAKGHRPTTPQIDNIVKTHMYPSQRRSLEMLLFPLLPGKAGGRSDEDTVNWNYDLLGNMGWYNFNSIRIAFRHSDYDKVDRLLFLRREEYVWTPLDEFFNMRLAMARGQLDQAADCYRRAVEVADVYGARSWLEAELKMAADMSLIDFAHVCQHSGFSLQEGYPEIASGGGRRPRSGRQVQILGQSADMLVLRQSISNFAPLHQPVLVRGETGTGKELVARSLHAEGGAERPFVAINCAAINEQLLEAELFGHVKGAYTGATNVREGLFAKAAGGTLFLDEIGDTGPRFQAALLRVLEEGEYRPVGSDSSLQVRCRIVAATNRQLETAIEEGAFRADLYHRLQHLVLRIPNLYARRSDIPLLARHFVAQHKQRSHSLADELIDYLQRQTWPGNVRQLRNHIDLLCVHRQGHLVLTLADYIAVHGQGRADASSPRPDLPVDPRLLRREQRLQTLRRQFRDHQRLTRKQVASLLQVSAVTATADLRQLISEGLIKKVAPTAAARTHYFELQET